LLRGIEGQLKGVECMRASRDGPMFSGNFQEKGRRKNLKNRRVGNNISSRGVEVKRGSKLKGLKRAEETECTPSIQEHWGREKVARTK